MLIPYNRARKRLNQKPLQNKEFQEAPVPEQPSGASAAAVHQIRNNSAIWAAIYYLFEKDPVQPWTPDCSRSASSVGEA